MKRLSKIFASYLMTFMLLVAVASGCSSPANTDRAVDYLSPKPNTLYTYSSEEMDLASYQIYYDYVHEDNQLYQRRVILEGSCLVEVFSYKNGILKNYYADSDVKYFWDMTSNSPNTEIVVLKEPLDVGAKWTRAASDDSKYTAEVTGHNIDVSVPYGDFKAMEVTVTQDDSDQIIKEYYVKGLGLVKTDTTGEDYAYSSSLSAVEENASVNIEHMFFYPAEYTMELYYEIRNVNYATNSDSPALLTDLFNNYTEYPGGRLFGSDTVISSLSYSSESKRAKLNFTNNPVSDNISPEEETTVLQSVVNTIGNMFNVSEVCITVNGQGYSSKNISMGRSEYIKVDSLAGGTPDDGLQTE